MRLTTGGDDDGKHTSRASSLTVWRPLSWREDSWKLTQWRHRVTDEWLVEAWPSRPPREAWWQSPHKRSRW